MERVVITGMGVASPLGCTAESFWEGLLAGRSGVVPVDEAEFGTLRTRIGARLAGYDERQYFDAKEARRIGMFADKASERFQTWYSRGVRPGDEDGEAVPDHRPKSRPRPFESE